MAGMTPISAYQATSRSWETKNASSDRAGAYAPVKDQTNSVKGNSASKVETKSFSPIEKQFAYPSKNRIRVHYRRCTVIG